MKNNVTPSTLNLPKESKNYKKGSTMNEQITTETPELDVPEFLKRQHSESEKKRLEVFVQTAEDKGEGDKPVTVQ